MRPDTQNGVKMDISILATRRPRFQCKPREAFSATCGGPLRRIPPSRAMLSGCIARRVAKRSCNASAVPDRQEDPTVSEGACAQALRAHPHELLSVAVTIDLDGSCLLRSDRENPLTCGDRGVA